MKKAAFIFLSQFFCFTCFAQTEVIKQVFRLLPQEKVFDLSVATRDSMLQGKTYYPADNTSDEIVAYNYGVSTEIESYIYVSLSFETDQRATSMVEIRSFKMLNGDNLILVSKTGGVLGVAYDQHEISAYTYSKSKKLIPYKKTVLPKAQMSLLIKPGAPESVRKTILSHSNITYNLSHQKIQLELDSNYIDNDLSLKKWLKGNRISFNWKRDKFVMSTVGYE